MRILRSKFGIEHFCWMYSLDAVQCFLCSVIFRNFIKILQRKVKLTKDRKHNKRLKSGTKRTITGKCSEFTAQMRFNNKTHLPK